MIRGRSKWLAERIQIGNYTIGAEVGAAIGLTSSFVLANCPGLVSYIVIDDWRRVPGSGIFDSLTMKQTFLSKVGKDKRLEIIEGLSWEGAEKVKNESLDFVFIDASHDYESVKKDILAWMPKIRPGGMLSGHDVHWEGVQEALNELVPGYSVTGIDHTWMFMMPRL